MQFLLFCFLVDFGLLLLHRIFIIRIHIVAYVLFLVKLVFYKRLLIEQPQSKIVAFSSKHIVRCRDQIIGFIDFIVSHSPELISHRCGCYRFIFFEGIQRDVVVIVRLIIPMKVMLSAIVDIPPYSGGNDLVFIVAQIELGSITLLPEDIFHFVIFSEFFLEKILVLLVYALKLKQLFESIVPRVFFVGIIVVCVVIAAVVDVVMRGLQF